MNAISRLAIVLIVAVLVTGLAASRSLATQDTVLQQSPSAWHFYSCSRTLATERGLWFDTAGPGVNDEGALFWFLNKSTTNESCTVYSAVDPAVSTTTYPRLTVRAAVNDSARFYVRVYDMGVGEFCEHLLATLSWSATEDHSGFLTKNLTLPTGKSICQVRVMLTDDPDITATGRTNALIGDIRIWNGQTYGWRETFAANP